MEQKRLGKQGLIVSAMGLGCMGMSDAYGPADEAESVATIRRVHAVHPISALRPSIRCGAATRRTNSSPPSGNWASASSRTARSAAASSPASCDASRICHRTTGVATGRGSRERTSRRTWNSWTG